MLPKGLLILHSGYFEEHYATAEEDQKPPSFPDLSPAHFLHFASWLITGEWLRLGGGTGYSPLPIPLWQLGDRLRAPAFMNDIMDTFRPICRFSGFSTYSNVYNTPTTSTNLRKLMAHTAASIGPLQRWAKGSAQHTKWQDLFRGCPELALDMLEMLGKEWKDTWPGDDEYRSEYMEADVLLEEKWEKKILKVRTIEEIRTQVQEGCVWSVIELDHLERKKTSNQVAQGRLAV